MARMMRPAARAGKSELRDERPRLFDLVATRRFGTDLLEQRA